MKKTFNYIKENKKKIILITSAVLFTIITYFIFNNQINNLDTLVHSYILGIRNKNLTSILLTITNISSAYALIVLSILLLIIIKEKKIPLLITLNLICSYALNAFAKVIFTRPRPIGINLIEESGFSYPSGHSMVSMAYYGFIAYLIYKKQTNKLVKTIIIVALLLTILLVGFSRIYLGVHYLSDVIGGFLLSIIYLMIFIKYSKIEKK
jgi:undecaprenyl-diphosphatase